MDEPPSPPPAAAMPSRPPPPPAPRFEHRRTQSEVLRAKRLERSDIKSSEWGKCGYSERLDVLTRPVLYDSQTVPIPRISRATATPEWFLENVAMPNRPVIVEGACAHWPAMTRWAIDKLDERFRHVDFKVGEDDRGKKIKMKFKYFADYMRHQTDDDPLHQTDDNPLYLFETEMEDNAFIKTLTEDFEVPDFFPDDWLNLVNRDARPPHRWWCIGPKRSGTTVHTDPLGTSAWNAVTHGCKHWVLFEPQTAKRVVKGKSVREKSEGDEAIHYFDFILPRIKKAHPEVRVYQGLQKPGDVIFVPGGWWHGVLNMEDCVAVTQNYCGPDNFEVVWRAIRKDREKTAYLWLRNMCKFAPKLYGRALELNRGDGFCMRHERKKGERLPDASSSSSDSSDSSSDMASDFAGVPGLQAVVPAELLPGAGMRPRRVASPMAAQASRGEEGCASDGSVAEGRAGPRELRRSRRSRSRSRDRWGRRDDEEQC